MDPFEVPCTRTDTYGVGQHWALSGGSRVVTSLADYDGGGRWDYGNVGLRLLPACGWLS